MKNELKDLFSEFKQYLRLEERFVLLSLAEKLTVLVAMLIIIGILLALASILVAFLLMGMAHYIGFAIGNLALGYAIVAAAVGVLMCVFYILRTALVINPLARFIRGLFASTTEEIKK